MVLDNANSSNQHDFFLLGLQYLYDQYLYVQSNQWNTRDDKKPLLQEQPFFLQSSSLFLSESVSSLLNKESVVA